MPIRTIFIDFGGTLVRDPPDPYPTFRSILSPMGYEVSAQRYDEADRRVAARIEPLRYDLLGKTPSMLDLSNMETLRALGVPDPEGRIVARLHDAFTSPDWRPTFPETVEVLKILRASGVGIYILSNSTDMLLETIARRGWGRLLSGVTFSQEAGAEKPDNAIFQLALTRAECRAADAVHVGDSWRADYLGAREAGLNAIWLNRDRRACPAPCTEIQSLRELPAILRDQ
ncbi:MAG: HAD family hydrolase [Thermoplasmata archaeon]